MLLKQNILFVFVLLTICLSAALKIGSYEHEKSAKAMAFSDNGIVIIDAGHGGEDGGAIGKDGILEKEINLSVSKKTELLLNLFGISTDMTRRDDISLASENLNTIRERKVSDIKKRVSKINAFPNAVLISIHQNSFPQESCRGHQVFYSTENETSKYLAEYIDDAIKNGIPKSDGRKVKPADKSIYIFNNIQCPAVLVECGFISNPEEARFLMSNSYRTKLAMCVASGFLKFQK